MLSVINKPFYAECRLVLETEFCFVVKFLCLALFEVLWGLGLEKRITKKGENDTSPLLLPRPDLFSCGICPSTIFRVPSYVVANVVGGIKAEAF
jgi:hypothetical protein